MSSDIDIATLRWAKLDPRNGNYEDCQAWVELRDAVDYLVGAILTVRDVVGWCRIDTDRTAYRVSIEDVDEAVWIVTTDHDGAPDGHRKAKRVEVIRW